MKALLALSLALVTVAPASAEIFRSPASGGRPRGGHDHPGRSTVHVARPGHHYSGYIYRHRPSVYVGIGPAYYPSYGYSPSYGYYPGYGGDYPYYGDAGYYGSPSAASSGFWLGALAGGIIGHNNGSNNALRGAAWGAGAGWLLGSIADANRRPAVYRSAPAAVAQPVQAAAPAQAPAPQQVTIINNYYNSSPMSGANSLFGR